MTIFETERLVVREWTDSPGDLERAYDIYRRPETNRWLQAPNLPLTAPEEAGVMLRRRRDLFAPYGDRYGLWAIEVRESGLVVGTVVIKPLPGLDEAVFTDDIEVGWHLHPEAQGKGYATEAARAAMRREFATGTAAIFAVVMPGNTASIAVTRRLGMTPVGLRSDWYGGKELETFVATARDFARG